MERVHGTRKGALRQRPRSLHGFTLIELLVVVTIIVVLLALLAPALDQAIYQAELATCAAQLKSVAGAVTLYAMDFQRRYPHRPSLGTFRWQVSELYNTFDANNDLRSVIEGRIDLNLFNCPLAGGVKYGTHETDANIVLGNYEMWFGWGYDDQKIMARMGDRFTWHDGVTEHHFSVLVSDHELMKPDYPEVQATHPDRSPAEMSLWKRYDEKTTAVSGTQTEVSVTYSTWYRYPFALANRGAVDRSFAYADGSVTRRVGLRFSSAANTVVDALGEELLPVPEYSDNVTTNRRYLPPQ